MSHSTWLSWVLSSVIVLVSVKLIYTDQTFTLYSRQIFNCVVSSSTWIFYQHNKLHMSKIQVLNSCHYPRTCLPRLPHLCKYYLYLSSCTGQKILVSFLITLFFHLHILFIGKLYLLPFKIYSESNLFSPSPFLSPCKSHHHFPIG